ncbi:MAG: BREX system Lon protease-like protein BrxL [Methanosarcinales archaeon]
MTTVNPYYFDTLPEYLQVSALLDRLNDFIPGWELSSSVRSCTL